MQNAPRIVPFSHAVVPGKPTGNWRAEMKSAIRDPVELCRILRIPQQYEAPAVRSARLFPVFAPRGFVEKIERGNLNDPLLRQILPLRAEEETPQGFAADPVGDTQAQLVPGLLKKYRSRALMVATGACAVHCRYCFRRAYPYDQLPRGPEDWQPALDEIAADTGIDEVLLSGGDPLTLVDGQLKLLANRLSAIDHLRRLRIHTRLPIMIPQRVTGELIDWLAGTRLTPIFVVHANHPAELDEPVLSSLARLIDAGIVVLNQAVLLRGVNDDAETLTELCRRLVDHRVMPYYLHQLDRTIGAAHFEVPIARGVELVAEVRNRLPGYAVPRYAQEIAGEAAKRVLA